MEGRINVRAGNALQQQTSLAVNSGHATDSYSSQAAAAAAEGVRPGVRGVHCHTRCTPRYYSLSRAGAFLRSVWREGPYTSEKVR
jgi:hypothetical protein